jgi:hypothetical protein
MSNPKNQLTELASSLYNIQKEIGAKQLKQILDTMVQAIPISFLKGEQGKEDLGGGIRIFNLFNPDSSA